ncbi:CBS domain-containing protein [Heliophilum fasciatum]|uniref:CBS domain protein n=1 Tax=Heliophilum fasciatum TaxID=35700 RepID=A0A4R2RWR7_9FIRM|nr:CBS domain-containing protein [Heliophilum fasciatum]MCW2276707.1 CBS domain-containing protein [Heliophilum fasciatum]TCP68912.1 CBS domain protein [Heliophilum fasciatum]
MRKALLVKDRMVSPVVTTRPTTTISEVLQVMTEQSFRRVPVVDAEMNLVGIIAFHDIDRAMRSPGVIPLTPVDWVMMKNPVSVEQDEPLGSAIRLMRRYKVSGLPVLCQGKVIGIFSITDALELCSELLEEEE